MKKERIKGWLELLIAVGLLYYAGTVYAVGGFGIGMIYTLAFCLATVPVLFTDSFRRFGMRSVLVMLIALGLTYAASGDPATSVLVWSLCCAVPAAVAFVWPRHRQIKPLAMHALPLAGGIALGGTLVYCKLHFGSWALNVMMERISLRLGSYLDQMEALYLSLFYADGVQNPLPDQLAELFALMRQGLDTMAFSMILWVVYALFGLFFLSVCIADRNAARAGGPRVLGPWRTLIPSRGISWIYMTGYLIVLLVGGSYAQTLIAVFDLFGFLFVFTALYRLLQFFRQKNMPSLLRKLLIGGLFAVAFATVGGGLLFSPYTILLYIGWWIATLPAVIKIQKK